MQLPTSKERQLLSHIERAHAHTLYTLLHYVIVIRYANHDLLGNTSAAVSNSERLISYTSARYVVLLQCMSSSSTLTGVCTFMQENCGSLTLHLLT